MKSVKHKRPRPPLVTEPSVLICHEKHVKWYFYVDSDAALFAIALQILTARLKSKYYYYAPDADALKNPGMTKGDAERLPEGRIRDVALQQVHAYESKLREFKEAQLDWDELQSAIKEKDGKKAWQVLWSRSDSEYERITIETLSTEYTL